MAELPVIQPDESGDVPRCRKECPSFVPSAFSGEYGERCRVDQSLHGPFVGVTVCQPKLLRAYAELRELKERTCGTCDCYDYPGRWCNLNGGTRAETDYCREGWEPKR